MNSTSESIIQRLADPADSGAWRVFAEIYIPAIHRWLRQLSIPPSDRDDITQDIVIRVNRELGRNFIYDSNRSFRGWLYTLSRNVALNYFRSEKRHLRFRKQIEILEAEDPHRLSEVFSRQEFAKIICQRLLDQVRLTVEDQTFQAFYLSVIEEKSISQVSDQLGISLNAVAIARHRVLKRLRNLSHGLID